MANTISIWNSKIIKQALAESFTKLNPRRMMKNPVMFVVEIGAVLTTLQFIRGIVAPTETTNFGFELQITLWLWFTVLFANFAEAMAEGRGKAQAETLRKSKTETTANRPAANGVIETVSATEEKHRDFKKISRLRAAARKNFFAPARELSVAMPIKIGSPFMLKLPMKKPDALRRKPTQRCRKTSDLPKRWARKSSN